LGDSNIWFLAKERVSIIVDHTQTGFGMSDGARESGFTNRQDYVLLQAVFQQGAKKDGYY
jgi:hypothetical protein